MEARPLSSSIEAYSNAYKVYLSNSTLRETLEKYSGEAAAHVMRNLTDKAKNSEIFQVLGVGSGDGNQDIEVLKVIATSLRSSRTEKPSIHTCIVEPSSSLITDFRRSVTPLPASLASLADVSFDWKETGFEDYICSSSPSESNRYHIAHFICSLYYMDAEDALKSCFKQVANGGAMFCSVAGDDSYFIKFSENFHGKLKCLATASNFYIGKDVAAIAERNNWKYEEYPKAQYEIDITSCFDRSSQTGRVLLDFMTHQIDFQGTADPILYDEVMEFLTESSITDSSGRKILTTMLAMVIIYK